jgi:hypothetical protein
MVEGRRKRGQLGKVEVEVRSFPTPGKISEQFP